MAIQPMAIVGGEERGERLAATPPLRDPKTGFSVRVLVAERHGPGHGQMRDAEATFDATDLANWCRKVLAGLEAAGAIAPGDT